MQRQRSVTVSTLAAKPSAVLLLTAGLLFNCGDDEALDVDPRTPIVPGGGAQPGNAGSGNAGSAGDTPGGTSSNGGNNAAIAGDGQELGGVPGGGSIQAGAPPATAGTGGGGDEPATEQLSFGPRITAQAANAGDVAREYNHATYEDCRTRWVTDLFLSKGEQHVFLNDLVAWNLRFWGCQGEPVDNFALIYGTAPLSAGDASLLIEHYIAIATEELTLSPLEITEMRGALERLSEPLITDSSTEPSQPRCDTGSAGQGGAASDPVGGAGAGGTASSETAGQGGAP